MNEQEIKQDKRMVTIKHPRLHCPYCGGKRTKQQTTHHKEGEAIRYYLCRECAHTFKTSEAD